MLAPTPNTLLIPHIAVSKCLHSHSNPVGRRIRGPFVCSDETLSPTSVLDMTLNFF